MDYSPSPAAIMIFAICSGILLACIFFLSRRAKATDPSAAAGLAPAAGNPFSATVLLGICGLIAFYGYDGFLYSIGLFAGWVAALLLFAEPLKRIGARTFSGVLISRFSSPNVRRAAAISAIIISTTFLIPELIAAGALLQPLLGLPFSILATSTGILALIFHLSAGPIASVSAGRMQCFLLTTISVILAVAVFHRGLAAKPVDQFPRVLSTAQFNAELVATDSLIPNNGGWASAYFLRIRHADGSVSVWKYTGIADIHHLPVIWPAATFTECQLLTQTPAGERLLNGKPPSATSSLRPVSFINHLPGNHSAANSLEPVAFLSAIQQSSVALPMQQTIADDAGINTVYFPALSSGQDVLTPGNAPMLFPHLRTQAIPDALNFASLLLALFFGTAVLPGHFPDVRIQPNAPGRRKSQFLTIFITALLASITLFLGLGALATGKLDPANSNLALPLLAKTFGNLIFAIFCAIAFSGILYAACNQISTILRTIAASLPADPSRKPSDDVSKSSTEKIAPLLATAAAIILAICLQHMNIAFLLGWAISIAVSATLPALAMSVFWKRATAQGITASIYVGLLSSLVWILLSADIFANLFGLPAATSPIPFNQPALIATPLAFLTLIFVSRRTPSA